MSLGIKKLIKTTTQRQVVNNKLAIQKTLIKGFVKSQRLKAQLITELQSDEKSFNEDYKAFLEEIL